MAPRTKRWWPGLAAICAAASVCSLFTTVVRSDPKQPESKSAQLPLPSTFLPDRLPEFQKILSGFLQGGDYLNLGWSEDKGLRDTGPFINGKSYGVHPTVKIYYSPEIMTWLVGGREGTIPDGAMIVKEQYKAPAARYQLASNSPA